MAITKMTYTVSGGTLNPTSICTNLTSDSNARQSTRMFPVWPGRNKAEFYLFLV